MKSLFRLNSTILLIFLTLASHFALAQGNAGSSDDGGSAGSGGAGISDGTKYMTFYEAGLYTEPQPVKREKIPQIKELIDFLQGTNFWSVEDRINLVNEILPSENHKYYRAVNFDAKATKRILDEYHRRTNEPIEKLTLYAVTDIEKRITYLLPPFYELSDQGKQAILFHESYWLIFPKATYDIVRLAEEAFQAVLVEPKNLTRVAELMNYYGSDMQARVEIMIKADLETGAMKGLLQKDNTIFMSDLFGKASVDCYQQGMSTNYQAITRETCTKLFAENLFQLTEKYPQSRLVNYFYDSVSKYLSYYLDKKETYYHERYVNLGLFDRTSGVPFNGAVGKLGQGLYNGSYAQNFANLSECSLGFPVHQMNSSVDAIFPTNCHDVTDGKRHTLTWDASFVIREYKKDTNQ